MAGLSDEYAAKNLADAQRAITNLQNKFREVEKAQQELVRRVERLEKQAKK